MRVHALAIDHNWAYTEANCMTVSFHIRDSDDGEVRTPLQTFSLDRVAATP